MGTWKGAPHRQSLEKHKSKPRGDATSYPPAGPTFSFKKKFKITSVDKDVKTGALRPSWWDWKIGQHVGKQFRSCSECEMRVALGLGNSPPPCAPMRNGNMSTQERYTDPRGHLLRKGRRGRRTCASVGEWIKCCLFIQRRIIRP